MRQILIIADDLSGAADCAIACIGSGLNAVVALDDLDREFTSEVLSIDCDTRHLKSAAAADRVMRVLRRYMPDPDLLVFKKLDSTLRGNVGAELAAILEERRRFATTGRRIVAIMTPAFPAGGRTTIDGQQMVHGTPLHESETWRHQEFQGSTHIPSMLAMSGLCPVTLGLDIVRSGDAPLQESMMSLAATADVLVCDVETEGDLRAIARASLVLGRETVWAGSAGLAYYLPHAAGLSSRASDLGSFPFTPGPTLFVIGSRSSVSREQVNLLEKTERLHTVQLSPRVLLAGQQSSQWREYARNIATSLQSGQDTLVVIRAGEQLDTREGRLLSDALGTMMLPLAKTVGALVASGGETARAILYSWGIRSLHMVGEVEPGLPFAATEGWNRRLAVLTKAGAFGSPQTLLRCRHFLSALERDKNVASIKEKVIQ